MATKVLLIEDEPLLISLYSLVLSKAGYEIATAMDAATGEEKLIINRPHVLLLDLLIPTKNGGGTHGESFHEPNGFQILRLVKGTPSLSSTRVMILSNLDSDEHKKTAANLGADAYVVKSNLDPHELKQRVDSVLHNTANGPMQMG